MTTDPDFEAFLARDELELNAADCETLASFTSGWMAPGVDAHLAGIARKFNLAARLLAALERRDGHPVRLRLVPHS